MALTTIPTKAEDFKVGDWLVLNDGIAHRIESIESLAPGRPRVRFGFVGGLYTYLGETTERGKLAAPSKLYGPIESKVSPGLAAELIAIADANHFYVEIVGTMDQVNVGPFTTRERADAYMATVASNFTAAVLTRAEMRQHVALYGEIPTVTPAAQGWQGEV